MTSPFRVFYFSGSVSDKDSPKRRPNRNTWNFSSSSSSAKSSSTTDARVRGLIEHAVSTQIPELNLQGKDEYKISDPHDIEAISQMTWLVSLDLSMNRLSSLPDEFENLHQLATLNLSRNEFGWIPACITSGMDGLQNLQIRLNNIQQWPVLINNMKLSRLDLAFNKISRITFSNTKSVSRLLTPVVPNFKGGGRSSSSSSKANSLQQTLLVLDLSFNAFEGFPMEVLQFVNLQQLNLTCNQLHRIPPEIIKLKNSLLNIGIGESELTTFPDSLFRLSGLTELDIHSNPITVLPSTLPSKLPNLQVLDVTGCELISLEPLVNLKCLRVLKASKNKISSLADRLLLKSLCNLQVLDLAQNQLSEIPNGRLGLLTALHTLNLSQNALKSLPEDLKECLALENLILHSNEIACFPGSMSLNSLEKLISLDISKNRFRSLPNVSSLCRLVDLRVNNNELESLPAGIGHLTNLQTLHAHINCITSIPPELYNLQQLEELLLRRNAVETVSPLIAQMSRLQTLNLNNNDLRDFPFSEIVSMQNTTLKQLALSQNSPDFRCNKCNNRTCTCCDAADEDDEDEEPGEVLQICQSQGTIPPEFFSWVRLFNVKFENDFETPDKIIPGLFLGSATAATSRRVLMSLSITHILTVASDIPPPHPRDFVYIVVPAEDAKQTNLRQYFEKCFAAIDEARQRGGIMVHCLQGKSRSPTIVVAYLMQLKGIPLKTAFSFVNSIRSIMPNPSFRQQLVDFEKELQQAGKIKAGGGGRTESTSVNIE